MFYCSITPSRSMFVFVLMSVTNNAARLLLSLVHQRPTSHLHILLLVCAVPCDTFPTPFSFLVRLTRASSKT